MKTEPILQFRMELDNGAAELTFGNNILDSPFGAGMI